MSISKRLKELRENKGLTQEQISHDLSLNRATYAHYETGRRQPDLDMIKLMADYHNCSLDYLLGKTDIRSPYDEFLKQAKEQYGPRGQRQAEELLEGVQGLFDGGELPDEDKDEFFRAITDIYFDSKEKNKKYTPKEYRKNKGEADEDE